MLGNVIYFPSLTLVVFLRVLIYLNTLFLPHLTYPFINRWPYTPFIYSFQVYFLFFRLWCWTGYNLATSANLPLKDTFQPTNGSQVFPVDNISILGLNINRKCKFHITMIVKSASKYLFRRIFSSSNLFNLYKGFIGIYLEYCSHTYLRGVEELRFHPSFGKDQVNGQKTLKLYRTFQFNWTFIFARRCPCFVSFM